MAQRQSTTRQKIAHFDTPMGIAGDMTIGALLDVGGSRAVLARAVRALALPGVQVCARVERHQKISGTNFTVQFSERVTRENSTLSAHAITTRFRRAKLPAEIRATCVRVWQRILDADARVQRCAVRALEYSTTDACDYLIDIACAASLFADAAFTQVSCAPLPVLVPTMVRKKHPTARSAHAYAAPSFVAREIFRDQPVCESPVHAQLVTPTGAALMREFATHVGACPLRAIEREGRGFGDAKFSGHVNAAHLLIGTGAPLLCIEANVDDCNPEVYDYLIECVLAAGAIDVTLRPVLMKKRRPGVLVQVLCEATAHDAITRAIVRETTSFGVRAYPVERTMLRRERVPVKFGRDVVHVKLGWLENELLQCSPEYDDCKRVAKAQGIALREVYHLATVIARSEATKQSPKDRRLLRRES